MRTSSAKEKRKILSRCERRLAANCSPNIGGKNAGMNTSSESAGENISPRVDNNSQKSSLPPRRKFAGSLKLQRFFLCGGGGDLFYFLFLFFTHIMYWLFYIFYTVLLGYYLGRVSREWKDYNIVFRLLTIIIIVCCIRNIFHFAHFIAQNFSLWTFWNF